MEKNNNQLQPMMPTGVATPAVLPAALQPYSPTQLSVTFSEVRTVEQALAAKAPSFGSLVSQGKATKDELERLIMQHLVVMDAYLKQKNGLTPEEIASIAEEVVAKYYWVLTFADISVIFRNVRNGEYGELYNTITASKVLGWFAQYEQERSKKCEELAQSRSNEEKPAYSIEELNALGYRLTEDRRVVNINPQQQGERKPPRWIYDEKGRTKDNPDYWRWQKRKRDDSTDKVLALAKEFMKEDRCLDIKTAIEKASAIIERQKQHNNG